MRRPKDRTLWRYLWLHLSHGRWKDALIVFTLLELTVELPLWKSSLTVDGQVVDPSDLVVAFADTLESTATVYEAKQSTIYGIELMIEQTRDLK